ncbi:MAG: hypothetical protein ACK51T_10800 [bacterium]
MPRAKPQPAPPHTQAIHTILDAPGIAILPLDTRWAATVHAGTSAPRFLHAVRAIEGTSTHGPTTWHAPTIHSALVMLPNTPLLQRAVHVLGPRAVTLAVELDPNQHAIDPLLTPAIEEGYLHLRLAPWAQSLGPKFVLADGLASVHTHAQAQDFAQRLSASGIPAQAFASLRPTSPNATPAGQPSTLVRLPKRGSFAVDRVGLVPAEDVRRLLTVRVLFVCTGNTCRSPMAQAIGQSLAERLPPGSVPIEVQSAGTAATDGTPPTREGIEALQALGVPPPNSRSRRLTSDLLTWADIVWTMTQSHARDASVLAGPLAPTAIGSSRIVQTLDPDGRDVPDPIGSPASVYRSTAQDLHRLIAKRFAHLQATQTQHANDQTNDTEART